MSPEKTVRNIDNDSAVKRGVVFNLLGTIGKAMMPVFFILVSRMYGAVILGFYVLVYTLIEMILKITVSGLNDAVTMFLSRSLAAEDNHERIYNVLINGFLLGTGIAVLLIVAIHAGALRLFPVYNEPELQEIVKIMVLGVPFYIIQIIIVAGSKAFIEMRWDALVNGFLRPFGFTVFAVVFNFFNYGLKGLALGYLHTGILLAVASLFIFHRYFSFRKLFHSLRTFTFHRALLLFTIPQNLNMTFNHFITNIDVMMLGYFRFHPALIGYYSIGAQIVRNLRQVKVAFSSAYAPVVARLHEEKKIGEMETSFNRTLKMTTLVAFPLGLLLLVFHRELLQLFNPDFGRITGYFEIVFRKFFTLYSNAGIFPDLSNTSFMMILILLPLQSAAIGLAGNVLVMSGYPGWNFLNSISVAVLNFVLNMLFIPVYGLAGAAGATVISALIISGVQLIEMKHLVGIRYSLRKNFRPIIALMVSLTIFFASTPFFTATVGKIFLTILLMSAYLGTLLLLHSDRKDMNVLFFWKKKT